MVEYIEYKKKQYPVRVSYYALKMTRKESGQTEDGLNKALITENVNEFPMEMYETLLWYALIAGAEVDGTELDIPREKMEFVLDGCFKEFLSFVEKFQPEVEVGAEKKQVPLGNRQQRRAAPIKKVK